MEGLGTVTWWGFSPAVDLVSAYTEATKTDADNELNVLLVGAGDPRHILKTVAKLYKTKCSRINFYVLENSIEPIGRQIALLIAASESPLRFNLQEKAEMYLEILGNMRVRAAVANYITDMCDFYIRLVSDPEFNARSLPFVKLDDLKFRERDALDAVFKMWRAANQAVTDSRNRHEEEVEVKRGAPQPQRAVNKHGVLEKVVPFDASKCWDVRLREHLAVRYDVMNNVFDFDYSMKLLDKERETKATIISHQEYCGWRRDGVAFTLRDADYNIPNRTLASARVFNVNGDRTARLGYWGDIIVSPFVPIGIETEEASFFKTQNGRHVKTASNVAEFNVKSWMHEMHTASPFQYTEDSPDKGAHIIGECDDTGAPCSSSSENDANVTESEDQPSKKVDAKSDVFSLRFERLGTTECTVTFLSPATTLEELAKKSKWAHKFHVMYFSNSMVHLLKANEAARAISAVGQSACLIENVMYIIELKTEQIKAYSGRVSELAQQAGYSPANSSSDFSASPTLLFSSSSN